MLNIVISLLTFVLIILSLFMVLVILMQRANPNAGMGSAFGGGAAESAFGADTANVLTKATKWSAAGFFILPLVLYLMYMAKTAPQAEPTDGLLPSIATPAEPEEAAANDAEMAAEEVRTVAPAAMESVPETTEAVPETAESGTSEEGLPSSEENPPAPNP